MTSSKRQREIARRRAERQAQRRAQRQARRRRRNLVLTGVLAGVLVLALGAWALQSVLDDDENTLDAAGQPSATASSDAGPSDAPSAKPGECVYVDRAGESGGKTPGKPPAKPATPAATKGTITFASGKVGLSFLPAKAPCTVNSFQHLASKDFFDDTTCHRVTTSAGLTVVQCGDPTATGSGGPGYSFPDENLEGATYPRGTVAMANSGGDTNGSQFFLVVKDSQLPPSYIPFGTITSGLDVLDAIIKAGVAGGGTDGKPAKEVRIEDFTVST